MTTHDDYELGDEPMQVERAPRAGVVVSVRLSPEEAERLFLVARLSDKLITEVAKEALLQGLVANEAEVHAPAP